MFGDFVSRKMEVTSFGVTPPVSTPLRWQTGLGDTRENLRPPLDGREERQKFRSGLRAVTGRRADRGRRHEEAQTGTKSETAARKGVDASPFQLRETAKATQRC